MVTRGSFPGCDKVSQVWLLCEGSPVGTIESSSCWWCLEGWRSCQERTCQWELQVSSHHITSFAYCSSHHQRYTPESWTWRQRASVGKATREMVGHTCQCSHATPSEAVYLLSTKVWFSSVSADGWSASWSGVSKPPPVHKYRHRLFWTHTCEARAQYTAASGAALKLCGESRPCQVSWVTQCVWQAHAAS